MRQLHRLGLVPNYGPRPATHKRELTRLARERIRKVLWITPRRLVVWTARDRRTSQALGEHAVGFRRLQHPNAGWALLLWGRALLCLRGESPQ